MIEFSIDEIPVKFIKYDEEENHWIYRSSKLAPTTQIPLEINDFEEGIYSLAVFFILPGIAIYIFKSDYNKINDIGKLDELIAKILWSGNK